MLVYNVRHQGALGRDYQWHSREDAPGHFWLSVIVLAAATMWTGWLAYSEYLTHA
jgi:hypothetical protein